MLRAIQDMPYVVGETKLAPALKAALRVRRGALAPLQGLVHLAFPADLGRYLLRYAERAFSWILNGVASETWTHFTVLRVLPSVLAYL